ncbi:hypothetical protein [Planococcus sp. YIM B11945]|uniref:hypothetical protein n=1 Tax=Planococcus sp. YIM B11945 TaxID=3435410 RepID=UPI003D7C5B13
MKAEGAMLIMFVLMVTLLWWKVILPIIEPLIIIMLAFFLIKYILIPLVVFLLGSILFPLALFLAKAALVLIVLFIVFLILGNLYLKFIGEKSPQ